MIYDDYIIIQQPGQAGLADVTRDHLPARAAASESVGNTAKSKNDKRSRQNQTFPSFLTDTKQTPPMPRAYRLSAEKRIE
jgi:hypothetical protein